MVRGLEFLAEVQLTREFTDDEMGDLFAEFIDALHDAEGVVDLDLMTTGNGPKVIMEVKVATDEETPFDHIATAARALNVAFEAIRIVDPNSLVAEQPAMSHRELVDVA